MPRAIITGPAIGPHRDSDTGRQMHHELRRKARGGSAKRRRQGLERSAKGGGRTLGRR